MTESYFILTANNLILIVGSMFIQAVVSSFVSTPSNIDRALLLSVTTIATNQLRSLANIRGSVDFSRVVDEKGCELQEFGNRNTNIFHPITESLRLGFAGKPNRKSIQA